MSVVLFSNLWTHNVKFVLPLLVFLVLVQFLEVGCVGTPELHGRLGPDVDHAVGDGEDNGTYWVPLQQERGKRNAEK